jgi:hypothetical protein
MEEAAECAELLNALPSYPSGERLYGIDRLAAVNQREY